MIIVEKPNFQICEMHRLRGHLSNSHYPSDCVYVLSDDANEESVALGKSVMNLMDLNLRNG